MQSELMKYCVSLANVGCKKCIADSTLFALALLDITKTSFYTQHILFRPNQGVSLQKKNTHSNSETAHTQGAFQD
jgi:hypothetical protein